MNDVNTMNEQAKIILKKCTTTYYTGLGERDDVNMELFAELLWKEAYNQGYLEGIKENAREMNQLRQKDILASWRENPDRMGGCYTEEELKRTSTW